MFGLDPIVSAIGLVAGMIAVFLLRALFQQVRTQTPGHPVRTAQVGGSPPRSRADGSDRPPWTLGSSPPGTTSPPPLSAGDRNGLYSERHLLPTETRTVASSSESRDFLSHASHDLPNGSGRHGSEVLTEEPPTILWSNLKHERMARFISFINFKGGVGKSTLAVETATSLAKHFGKRVLLVDLDPQTNATFYLMDHSEWQSWQESNGSLKTLFDAYLNGRGSSFDVSQVIKKNLLTRGSKTSLAPGLALLPSHLALIQVDVQLASRTAVGESVFSNQAIIRQALQQVQDQYDYIIFDCPPNFNLVTQNGLFASDCYVIPAIPDYLSTLGINLIQGEVDRFSQRIRQALSMFGGTFAGPELRGIIFTRVRVRSRNPLRFVDLHERRIQEVYRTNPELVFKNFISEAVRFAEAPERQLPVSLSPRPEDRDARDEFMRLTQEFIERVGEPEKPQSTEHIEASINEGHAPENVLVS